MGEVRKKGKKRKRGDSVEESDERAKKRPHLISKPRVAFSAWMEKKKKMGAKSHEIFRALGFEGWPPVRFFFFLSRVLFLC